MRAYKSNCQMIWIPSRITIQIRFQVDNRVDDCDFNVILNKNQSVSIYFRLKDQKDQLKDQNCLFILQKSIYFDF